MQVTSSVKFVGVEECSNKHSLDNSLGYVPKDSIFSLGGPCASDIFCSAGKGVKAREEWNQKHPLDNSLR